MKRGFYHYVYGVDTSSSACVAAYITDCINQHSSDTEPTKDKSIKAKLFNKKDKKGKDEENEKDIIEKVLRGTFCIFDIVTQRDVRVEI